MYLARFESDGASWCTAALSLTATDPARGFAATLARHPAVDTALRLRLDGGTAQRLVMFSAPSVAQRALQACVDDCLRDWAAMQPRQPATADEFDALVELSGTHQLRVDPAGYAHRGSALGCDFKLYAALSGSRLQRGAFYQVNLHAHVPQPESEREVLKFLAWLELEKPFTEPVREVQRLLVERLRRPGWLGNEYLVCEDAEGLAQRLRHVQGFFAETTGRIGFQQLPLEQGDFSDALLSGLHDIRFERTPSAPVLRGAECFSAHEVDWLFGGGGVFAPPSARAARAGAPAPVFISYASADYRQACAVCDFLEAQGCGCWLAPRDIDRDLLPYTEAIVRGLSQAAVVVLLLSEGANLSVHIPRELDLALQRKLPIIPLRLQALLPKGQLVYLLSTCQWLDAFATSWPQVCAELLARLSQETRVVPAG